MRILSINALQRFDDWRGDRPNQAVDLADYAAGCGAEALVLVPLQRRLAAPAASAPRSRG